MVADQPTISPQDGRRLAALFKCGRCLFTLADQLGQPPHEILHWATLPHIQEAIDTITRLETDAHRAAAIEALRQTIDKSEDLVEKRRAACAILRALNPRPLRITPIVQPHTRHTPSHPFRTSPPAPASSPAPSPAAASPPSAAPQPSERHPAPTTAPTPPEPAPSQPASSRPQPAKPAMPPARPASKRTPAPFRGRSAAALLAQAARGPHNPLITAIDLRGPITLTNDSS